MQIVVVDAIKIFAKPEFLSTGEINGFLLSSMYVPETFSSR